MDTVPSSTDNTDTEEKFEDAADANENTQEVLQTPPERDSNVPSTQSDGAPPTDHDSSTNMQRNSQQRPRAGSAQPKSPLLTAHRMSRGSVDDGRQATQDVSLKAVQPVTGSSESSDPTKAATNKPLPRPSRFQGFTAALPSVPWGAPPKRAADPRQPSPNPPHTRKVTAPFAWLGRATSTPNEAHKPAALERSFDSRRNTATSISTVGSNNELSLKALEDGSESSANRPPARTSLREQFKMLRMREEAGVTSLENEEQHDGGAMAGLVGRSTSLGMTVGSPQSGTEDKDVISPVMSPSSPLPQPATVDPSLASGTVQGTSTSLADAATPIDWDFWQTVVNEGPQAVAKTSPEELTNAIASGIPQTIRGVIWQLLASSKNEGLESVYHDLKVRGTSLENRESVASRSFLNASTNGSTKEKESIASSSSSIHSDHSTPATSANAGLASPSPSHESTDPLNSAKLQAHLAAEKSKKLKDDATALSKLEKVIKRDMGSRTSYSKYLMAAGLQDGLFNVCKAYALFDDAVGYPQGMNFIIMPVLFTMPEEEAFCLLVRLMNKYHLRELFIQDMPGLHLHLYQFERLLEDLEPAVYCHLNRRGVTPKLYATQWFLTLFAYRFPLQLVMRVYDLVLCEGLEGAILKFGMAVIQRNVSTLLGMSDMLALTNFLKEKLFDVYIDQTPSSKSILESGFFGSSSGTDAEVYRADLLVQDACAVRLTPEMLARYRQEWEEKTTTEKARESELETLRSDLVTKTLKIRSLEDRAAKSDEEHIAIANDLVKLKVENSELLDSNESLQGQVEELKKVAESEARNVEERLRAEVERVTSRNVEVQGQNRMVEEQMQGLEEELVGLKMKYAESNAEHEALRQKMSELKKALG